MSGSYDEYLAARHGRWVTPDVVIRNTARDLLGCEPRSRRRIVGGETNEVYELALPGRIRAIMRISRDASKDFEQERWAIAACRALGVPAPRVLGIRHLTADGTTLHICLQEKLPGRLLSECKDLSASTRRSLLRQAGELLSRMHTVPVQGLGYLDAGGNAAPGTYADVVAELLAEEAEHLQLALRTGFEIAAMQAVLESLRALHGIADQASITFTHNDFLPKHILVNDDAVTGIIDFGEVSAEPAVNEFAKWDFLVGDAFPTAALEEGYADSTQRLHPYAELLHPLRLMNGLFVLKWYDSQGYAEGVADAKRRLYLALRP